MKFAREVLAASILTAAAASVGCQSTPRHVQTAVEAYWRGDYPASVTILQPDTQKKDENYVLANCRYGSAALAAGRFDEAEKAFYDAYLVINGGNVNDPGRQLATAILMENFKVWKGEPFERAMAHYYLGMIYLTRNEYGSARAAFRHSLFKLKQYEYDKDGKPDPNRVTEVDSQFALGYFGLGLCNLRMPGNHIDEANANFKLAIERQPSLAKVVEELKKPGTNTLIFVDYGQGPRMDPRGWYNEESAFGPTPAEAPPIPEAQVFVNRSQTPTVRMPVPLVDTLALAQQKQWQDIDTIRKVKAVVGTGMMVGGTGVAAYGAHRNDAGIALAGLGIAALGAGLAASSQADIRYWEMLPRTVYVVPMRLEPGTHEIVVRAGNSVSAPFQAVIKPDGQGDSVYYVRLR